MYWLVTAGGTREPIDPVRYIGNRSSGRMGYAIAAALAAHGHHVVLISAPTTLNVPDGVDFVQVETAAQMYDTVKHFVTEYPIEGAIMCAAVADYTPELVAERKIKKTEQSSGELLLKLVPTRDILGSLRSVFGFKGYVVGFAAETHDVLQYARKKLLAKGCNMLVANDVSLPGLGFDSSRNLVSLVYADYDEQLEEGDKSDLAVQIVHRIEHDLKTFVKLQE